MKNHDSIDNAVESFLNQEVSTKCADKQDDDCADKQDDDEEEIIVTKKNDNYSKSDHDKNFDTMKSQLADFNRFQDILLCTDFFSDPVLEKKGYLGYAALELFCKDITW